MVSGTGPISTLILAQSATSRLPATASTTLFSHLPWPSPSHSRSTSTSLPARMMYPPWTRYSLYWHECKEASRSTMDAIDFDTAFAPVPGRVDRVSPLVRRLVCNNPGPFTFTGTNTYIVGSGKVAVIDPGPDDADHLAALTEALRGETVSHILVTHTHRDHSPLADRLKALTGAPTAAFGPHGSGRVARARAVGSPVLDAAGDHDFLPDLELAD